MGIDWVSEKRKIEHIIGGPKTDIDGMALSILLDSWGSDEIPLLVDSHIQGAIICWDGWHAGDRGWLCAIHPAGDGSLAVQAAAGQPDLDLGDPAVAAVYSAASYAEIWDAEGDSLIEQRKVSSVSGAVVTLDSNLSNTHPAGAQVRARLDGFSPVRGPDGTAGGVYLIGSGAQMFRNELELTNPLPAGTHLAIRCRTTTDVGTRKLAISPILRNVL